MTHLRRIGASALLASTSVIAATNDAADASVAGGSWAATASTLSLGSLSNQVGFWQTLLCSNNLLPVDGNFGSLTKSRTIAFQSQMLHYTGGWLDGVVGWHTWSDTQAARDPDAPTYPALQSLSGGFYSYMAGGNPVKLYWDGGSTSLWKFEFNPGAGSGNFENSSSQWIQATNSRTITTGNCVFA